MVVPDWLLRTCNTSHRYIKFLKTVLKIIQYSLQELKFLKTLKTLTVNVRQLLNFINWHIIFVTFTRS